MQKLILGGFLSLWIFTSSIPSYALVATVQDLVAVENWNSVGNLVPLSTSVQFEVGYRGFGSGSFGGFGAKRAYDRLISSGQTARDTRRGSWLVQGDFFRCERLKKPQGDTNCWFHVLSENDKHFLSATLLVPPATTATDTSSFTQAMVGDLVSAARIYDLAQLVSLKMRVVYFDQL